MNSANAETDQTLPAMSLVRLFQLVSPMLPVGAYSYSQGLEWAVEAGTVQDRDTALTWIRDVLRYSVARFEAPTIVRLHRAWCERDTAAIIRWNEFFCVSRETAESRAETLQMGYSLRILLQDIGGFDGVKLDILDSMEPVAFPTAFSCAAVAWDIPAEEALFGYLWSWAENQVGAAMKTVPLGQVAGQQILASIGAELPGLVHRAMVQADDELSNYAPMLAIASSRHETQYSRLFRS